MLAMETLIRLAWALLALVHVLPAAVLVAPSLTQRLYGVAPQGDPGVLLIHRGALFLAVVAVCAYAAIEPGARRAASLVVAISVVGFLAVYARAGFPDGALRTIAIYDAVALLPLAVTLIAAWRPQGA